MTPTPQTGHARTWRWRYRIGVPVDRRRIARPLGLLAAFLVILAAGVVGGGWVTMTAQAPTQPQAKGASQRSAPADLQLPPIPGAKPLNIVFILTDDHRYDALGFLGHPFLETPHLDSLAKNGAYLKNAMVTTALCSPSRASILTGQYAHTHRVVDNNNPVPEGTIFFSQYLQKAGYTTAFIGKWHMGGEGADPQPGFDRWVSFPGQGSYLPSPAGLNVDGKKVEQKGYVTDELTDYAVSWLESRDRSKPFMLYLSHKAVHSEFIPAERHAGRYKDRPFVPPKTQAPGSHRNAPMWVQNQRNSWHGVEFAYHSTLDIAEYYRRYAETLLAVDDSVGRVLDTLKKQGVYDSTLVIFMGDNGFAFGEHGLIDKRTAYEESIRVPMLAQAPGIIKPGTVIEQVVANIDIAPTLLEAAGLRAPERMAGRSLMPLFRGEPVEWRTGLLYEYYWERNFPHTPTLHAIRGDRYKFIRAHGLWDLDELYDLRADPLESNNLIVSPEHQPIAAAMRKQLFDELERSGGMYIPLYRDIGSQQNLRRLDGSPAAEFPESMVAKP